MRSSGDQVSSTSSAHQARSASCYRLPDDISPSSSSVGASSSSAVCLSRRATSKTTGTSTAPVSPLDNRKLAALRIPERIELHRSSSGRNLRLKHVTNAVKKDPHVLTPRAPSRRPLDRGPNATSTSTTSAQATVPQSPSSSRACVADPLLSAVVAASSATTTSNSLPSRPSPPTAANTHENQFQALQLQIESLSCLTSHSAPEIVDLGTDEERIFTFDLWKKASKTKALPLAIVQRQDHEILQQKDESRRQSGASTGSAEQPETADPEPPSLQRQQQQENEEPEMQQQDHDLDADPQVQQAEQVLEEPSWRRWLERYVIDGTPKARRRHTEPPTQEQEDNERERRDEDEEEHVVQDNDEEKEEDTNDQKPQQQQQLQSQLTRNGSSGSLCSLTRSVSPVIRTRINSTSPPPPPASTAAAVTSGALPSAATISQCASRSSSLTDEKKAAIVKWKRGELIGEGTFGKVYKALNSVTGELFVIKQIDIRVATLSDAENERDRLKQVHKLGEEISLMKNLSHPHIVRYKGCHRSESRFFIFMEYVPGGSIASMLKQFDAFSEELIRIFTRQIVEGVAYLHSKGIIHRDIKGANVLVSEHGVAKLADFGCSKELPQIKTMSLEESLRSIRGSVPWMAPEVVKQSGHGFKADIWSIGATVIEMATAKHPWPECTNNLSALFTIATTKIPPKLPQQLSAQAIDFLNLCLRIGPEERATAEELLDHAFLAVQ